MTFSTAISSVFVPRINSMVARKVDPIEINKLFVKVGRVQFLVLALVLSGVVFFGRAFIVLWAGPGYEESYYIMLLLMVPVTIPLLQNLGIEVQKAQNRHHFRTWTYLIVAVINVLVSIPVVREFGAVGAALVTGISFLLGHGVLMNWYYHRRIGLNIIMFWKEIFQLGLGLLPAVVLGILMFIYVDLYHFPTLIISILAFVVAYLAGMWWLGMNRFERSLFGNIANRIICRAN